MTHWSLTDYAVALFLALAAIVAGGLLLWACTA